MDERRRGGSVTEFSVPGSGPASIAPGPDGAMWIGEGRAAGILRLTTSGVATETPLLSNPSANGIVTGPDKAIWFTEAGPNRIGRLTIAGITKGAGAAGPLPGAGALPVPPPTTVKPGGAALTGSGLRLVLTASAAADCSAPSRSSRRAPGVVRGPWAGRARV